MKNFILSFAWVVFVAPFASASDLECTMGEYIDCDINSFCFCMDLNPQASEPQVRISSGTRIVKYGEGRKAESAVELTMTNFTSSDYVCDYDYLLVDEMGATVIRSVQQSADKGLETVKVYDNIPTSFLKVIRVQILPTTQCFAKN
ncbi:MAG: hypothetical protein CL678_07465 [Bdellovibrionaceae bacterium]|nr:hypothetical protein [Pseudobdellovibrionaceae bacterium]|tara:strand:- start:492 stop:929 length:438 start_codon:yes stop_codon:yes gene_type:complete